MSQLHIADGFGLPVDAMTEAIALLSTRGRGKTHTATVFAEEVLKQHHQVVIVDPVGLYWGLRSSADGKGEGYRILVLGGSHGDLPLQTSDAETIARFVVEEEVSVVIDLSAFPSKSQQVQFCEVFFDKLWHLKQAHRSPLLLILEEAQEFAPQRPQRNEAVMLSRVERLAKLGRNYGIGLLMITQRPASLNKDCLDLVGILILLGLVAPIERKTAADWIGGHGDQQKGREILATLPSLPKGDAWLWWPLQSVLARIHVRQRETFDSSATPKVGQKRIEPGRRAEIDLDAFKAKLGGLIEKAKADDPRELRRIIHDQRLEIQKLHRQTTDKAADKTRVEIRTNTVEWVKRVPIGAEEIPHIRDLVGRLDDARKELGLIAQSLDHNRSAILKAGSRQLKGRAAQPAVGAGVNDRQERRTPDSLPALSTTAKARSAPPAAPQVSDGKLTGPEQRVLNALAWLDAVGFPQPTKIQIGFVADYRAGKKVGGTFGNILGRLRSAALIDYLSPGTATLTPAGRALASVPDIEQTTQGLQAAFYSRLDGPERRVLQAIVEAHPNDISKQDVGAAANYAVGDKVGGTFGNILGRLRSLGLIDYPRPGYVVALPVLFLEEC